ncbi:hypothetical protein FEK30_15130 [Picosynechococcus sp. PCC 11901]|uniref:hypothetical protein n=1 Tax=Picosynechococcus sp. PCC 11901 TaxID=2579791 RepID=UPI0010FBDA5D|nr:hypothetical protein [Picosynechococcus sp. PCC 11901]QCS50652.1 hypothetical protein FEK30_15130 [Picosynechococcus sp. PCC 11901]
MKKFSFALAAASALSLGLVSTAQAGQGGIAAGAAATFRANGNVESLSVAAAVGKDSAAVAVRSQILEGTSTETPVLNNGTPVRENVVTDPSSGITTDTGNIATVTVTTPGSVTNEAYALGGGSDIEVNSIASSEALNANNVAPNSVLFGGNDDNLSTPQANALAGGGGSFVVFDPDTGTVIFVDGNGLSPLN